jgi:hypothetical protein
MFPPPNELAVLADCVIVSGVPLASRVERDLPAAGEVVEQRAGVTEERQLPDVVHAEDVRAVVVHQSPFRVEIARILREIGRVAVR